MRKSKFVLDILCPTFGRPEAVMLLINDFIKLSKKDDNHIRLCVLDDGNQRKSTSSGFKSTPNYSDVEKECLNHNNILYVRKEKNEGLAKLIHGYYQSDYRAEFSFLLNDKDRLVTLNGFGQLVEKLLSNLNLNFIMTSLLQKDRDTEEHKIFLPDNVYSGREFLTEYIKNEAFQHCGMYSILRNDFLTEKKILKLLHLKDSGLDDLFGFDIQIVLGVCGLSEEVRTSSYNFVHRSTVMGATERFPLTFAVSYYQYAKHTTKFLRKKNVLDAKKQREYHSFWHLLIARGWVVSYRPVHKFEDENFERGTSRVSLFIKYPFLLYFVKELTLNRLTRWPEIKPVFYEALKLVIKNKS
jgi:hypothetical protein